MKVTISAIKADVGSIGGHTKPSRQMLDCVRQEVSSAVASGLLIDGFVSHTGDDIAILMTHARGESATPVRLGGFPQGHEDCTGVRAVRRDRVGRFSDSYIDFFDNPAWQEVGQRAQRKAIEMRSQGWSGAAMLPYAELEYGGFRDTVEGLLERFSTRGRP